MPDSDAILPDFCEVLPELRAIIDRNVARVLRSSGAASRADVTSDVEDVRQELLLELLCSSESPLERWDPKRGTVQSFVGMLARTRSLELLRKLQRRARLRPECCIEVSVPQPALEARQELSQLYVSMRSKLSATGLCMFERLFLLEEDVAQVSLETGLSHAAVYQWRSRLRHLIQDHQPSHE
ncbi:MAG TPA: hypothetical protein VHM70_20650 [Polyangiaceae bacterium]|jgi:hypothetical protein|nr:hypothetical protein [Polyangiaceae bacterium]